MFVFIFHKPVFTYILKFFFFFCVFYIHFVDFDLYVKALKGINILWVTSFLKELCALEFTDGQETE